MSQRLFALILVIVLVTALCTTFLVSIYLFRPGPTPPVSDGFYKKLEDPLRSSSSSTVYVTQPPTPSLKEEE